MRAQKLTLVLGLAVMSVLVVAFLGCSGDDSTPTSTNGSNNDPNFMAVQTDVDLMVDSTLEFFRQGLSNLSGINEGDQIDDILYGPGDPEDITTVTYDTATGWHVITIVRDRSTYLSSITDYIQFLDTAGAFQQYGSDAASLTYNHSWIRTMHDQNVTHSDVEGHATLSFSGLNTTQATISGTHSFDVNSKVVTVDSTVVRDISIDATLNSFTVNKGVTGWTDACPTTGSFTANVTMTYSKDDQTPVASTWTVTATFSNGSADIQVRRGSTIWNYESDLCTPVGVSG